MESLTELIKRNPAVPARVIKGYSPHETELVFHAEDPDLDVIKIKLPDPPPLDTIEGFGLPSKDQKWVRSNIPPRLEELVKNEGMIDRIWLKLNKSQFTYKKEIAFIREEWRRRLYGYWFFNNGVPTYIDGWHYFYMARWHIDIGFPEYRSRDRKFFVFARYCFTTQENELGIDMGDRTCYGFNYPKHRREGATYKADCILYELTSRTLNAWAGIQSMNEDSARKTFRKAVISPWKRLPFFFKPNYEGSTDPKSELSFNPPATRLSSKGSIATSDVGLESIINFDIADRNAYDGDKLLVHHDDETGKVTDEDVYARWQVAKNCLSQGSSIKGLHISTSTVGEMDKRGGRNFFNKCNASHFGVREKLTGRTSSGLFNLFIEAFDGLEGFIDEYGNSVIDTPTPQQAKFIKKKYGAREFLMSERKSKEEDHEAYSEQVRLFPIRFRECFLTSAKDSGFNLKILTERINEIEFGKNELAVGDFRWVHDEVDGKVEFIPKVNGKFKVSMQLPNHMSSMYMIKDGVKTPQLNMFIASADPFKFNKTRGKRKSDGGGAVLRLRDKALDPDTKDVSQWVTNNFVCTYSNRTDDKRLYAEDMLMMCVYFGALMYPEINVPIVWEYFIERGYGGYLMYQVDPVTGKMKATPGFNSGLTLKQDMFGEYMQFIEHHAKREKHIDLLEECRDIRGIEEMTDYDLFTAGGGCLLAAKNTYCEVIKASSENIDVGDYFPMREY